MMCQCHKYPKQIKKFRSKKPNTVFTNKSLVNNGVTVQMV